MLIAALLALPGWLPAVTLEELAAQPEHWPQKVTLTGMTKATVIKNGQPAGMMLLGTGRSIVVSAVTATEVTGRAGDATVRVPVDKTDILLQAAGQAQPAVAPVKTAAEPAATAAAAPAPIPALPAGGITSIQRQLAGRLVRLDHGQLKAYDARQLNGVKYYAVLFSAGWCGPCRQFAPILLEQYRQLKKAYPEFELVLYSWDHSPGDMADYMREENMPWPALKYDDREVIAAIARLAGPGIPCLVLIDAEGQVISHSFKGDEYLGPGVPLDAAWGILRKAHGG
jgi:thiol-disulfide isomerase/thioredoxin